MRITREQIAAIKINSLDWRNAMACLLEVSPKAVKALQALEPEQQKSVLQAMYYYLSVRQHASVPPDMSNLRYERLRHCWSTRDLAAKAMEAVRQEKGPGGRVMNPIKITAEDICKLESTSRRSPGGRAVNPAVLNALAVALGVSMDLLANAPLSDKGRW